MVLYNNTTKAVSGKADNQNTSLLIKALPWRFLIPYSPYNITTTVTISAMANSKETPTATAYCLKKPLLILTWQEYSKALKIAFMPFAAKKIDNIKTKDNKPPLGFVAISVMTGIKRFAV